MVAIGFLVYFVEAFYIFCHLPFVTDYSTKAWGSVYLFLSLVLQTPVLSRTLCKGFRLKFRHNARDLGR